MANSLYEQYYKGVSGFNKLNALNDYKSNNNTARQTMLSANKTNKETYESKKNMLSNSLNITNENIDRATNASLQQADILNQKLQKYIGNYNKANGINGGLAQSNILNQNNNIQKMYADINAKNSEDLKNARLAYEYGMGEAEQAYLAGKDKNYNTYLEALKSNRDTYRDNYKDEANTNYDRFLEELSLIDTNGDEIETAKAYSDLYDKYKGLLGENASVAAMRINEAIKALDSSFYEKNGKTYGEYMSEVENQNSNSTENKTPESISEIKIGDSSYKVNSYIDENTTADDALNAFGYNSKFSNKNAYLRDMQNLLSYVKKNKSSLKEGQTFYINNTGYFIYKEGKIYKLVEKQIANKEMFKKSATHI